jgi:hypothetical protein
VPKLIECVHAMKEVYEADGGTALAGWRKAKTHYVDGFGAASYINDETKEVIISFRGTVWTLLSNFREDLMIALGQLPSGFLIASRFDDLLRASVIPAGYKITYVGHSLGAIYASLLACLRKGIAVTLESPGISPMVAHDPRLKAGMEDPQTKIINILSAPNVINTLYPQAGKSYRVFIGHITGISYNHMVKSVLGSVKRAGAVAAIVAGSVATGGAAPAAAGAGTATATGVATGTATAAGASTVTAAASAASTARIYGTVATFMGAVSKISEHYLVKSADYFTWLLRQHRMHNLYMECDPSLGQSYPKIAEIVSWPNLTTAYPFVLSATGFNATLKSWVPFHRDVEGLHTLLEENRILEQRLAQIPGYQVNVFENEAAVALQKQIFDALHPAEEVDRTPLNIHGDDPVVGELAAYTANSQIRAEAALLPVENDSDAIISRAAFTDDDLAIMATETQEKRASQILTALQTGAPNTAVVIHGGAGAMIARPSFHPDGELTLD